MTPYTTKSGVKIGSEYRPTVKPHHDRDALRLQDALLGNKRSIDEGGVVIAAVVAIVIAAILIHFWSAA